MLWSGSGLEQGEAVDLALHVVCVEIRSAEGHLARFNGVDKLLVGLLLLAFEYVVRLRKPSVQPTGFASSHPSVNVTPAREEHKR